MSARHATVFIRMNDGTPFRTVKEPNMQVKRRRRVWMVAAPREEAVSIVLNGCRKDASQDAARRVPLAGKVRPPMLGGLIPCSWWLVRAVLQHLPCSSDRNHSFDSSLLKI